MSTVTISGLVKAGAKANESISLESMKYTSRLVVERALRRRGWHVAHFEENPPVLFIDIPGKRLIRVFSASPPSISYPATKISKDKHLANAVLGSVGLPTPEEIVVSDSSDPNLSTFLQNNPKVVVKPLGLSHGHGVWTDITDISTIRKAIKAATAISNSNKTLVQRQHGNRDARILCINYEYISAITRIPARVFGDGEHTVAELIDIENQSSERGENYKARLNKIDVKKARQYLGEKSIKRIPTAGEEVQVVGVSNVGAGGERMNITNDIPEWMKDMAIQACRVLELPVCGVDFLVDRIPSQSMSRASLSPVILEVNECPMMTMYEDFNSSEQHKVIDSYLDYLSETAAEKNR